MLRGFQRQGVGVVASFSWCCYEKHDGGAPKPRVFDQETRLFVAIRIFLHPPLGAKISETLKWLQSELYHHHEPVQRFDDLEMTGALDVSSQIMGFPPAV